MKQEHLHQVQQLMQRAFNAGYAIGHRLGSGHLFSQPKTKVEEEFKAKLEPDVLRIAEQMDHSKILIAPTIERLVFRQWCFDLEDRAADVQYFTQTGKKKQIIAARKELQNFRVRFEEIMYGKEE